MLFFGSNPNYKVTSFKLSVIDSNEYVTIFVVDFIDSSYIDEIAKIL